MDRQYDRDHPQPSPNFYRSRPLVVRVWYESCADAPPILRGTLSVIGGAQVGAFQSGPELWALLERTAGAYGRRPDA
jgi:hypothetical protein